MQTVAALDEGQSGGIGVDGVNAGRSVARQHAQKQNILIGVSQETSCESWDRNHQQRCADEQVFSHLFVFFIDFGRKGTIKLHTSNSFVQISSGNASR